MPINIPGMQATSILSPELIEMLKKFSGVTGPPPSPQLGQTSLGQPGQLGQVGQLGQAGNNPMSTDPSNNPILMKLLQEALSGINPVDASGPPPDPQKKGILEKIFANPQLLQGLAQIAMTTLGGKNGGYMGQGFQQGIQAQNQLDLQRQQLENQKRQQDQQNRRQGMGDVLDIYKTIQTDSELKANSQFARDKEKQAETRLAAEWMVKTGGSAEAAMQIHPQANPNALRAMAATMQQAEDKNMYWFDNKTGNKIATGDPNNPDHVRLDSRQITPLQARQQWRSGNQPYATPTEEKDQAKEVMINGKPGFANFRGGKYYDPATGADITAKVTPVSNSAGVATTAEWAAKVLKPGTREEMMAQVPPELRAIVEGLLEYRKAPPTGYALARSPIWAAALNYAYQIDPTYDEKEYPTRAKMMTAYTSGPSSREINAINTVLGHAAVLGEAINALDNGNIQMLNKIANEMKVQVGSDAITTFKAIVHRVGPEVTRAYVGTGGEFGERKENEGDFNPNYSPEQLKSNVAITLRLLRSKIGSAENQWAKTMGRDDFTQRFITKEAQAALDKWNPSGQTGAKKDPLGIMK